MAKELAIYDDRRYDGKALAKLPDTRRKFVILMTEYGAKPGAAKRAAKAVGFHPYYGHELMRDESVLAALREEATKKLAGSAMVGADVLLEIAYDKEHKDRFRAAKELAALNGFTPEQRIVVEHISYDSKAQLKQIYDMADQLGLNTEQAQLLIAKAGIIEAEFTEVQEQPEDTEMDPIEEDDGS